MATTTFRVLGMTCGGCEQSVARIIRQQPEVADVAVDRGHQEATVTWSTNAGQEAILRAGATICASVTAAGFDCSTS